MTVCPIFNCPAPSHGTYSSYRWGCRSEESRTDYRRYHKRLGTSAQVARRVPSIGPRRRLQALAALGHTWIDIAAEFDISWERISRIARGAESPQWMQIGTATAINELYDRRSMLPGPNAHTRSRALNRGWVPPLAWTNPDDPDEQPDLGGTDTQPDENVIAAVIADRLAWADMANVDREHLVATLFRRGWATADIADRAGADVNDVRKVHERLRAKQRRAAA